MPACCDPSAYRTVFDEANAASDARRYRKKGLDTTARRVVEGLATRGVGGSTVLEVGGGVGAILVELVARGAASGINVEIVGTYESAAETLLRERGLAGRIERRVLDFARDADAIPPADVVVLHRVVCCYPDPRRLVGAAAAHARRLLALTFPPDRWWWRVGIWVWNAWFKLRAGGFRVYVHDPMLIDETAKAQGLQPVFVKVGLVWQTAIYERAG